MHSDIATIISTLAIYAAVVVSPGPAFAVLSRVAVSGQRNGALGVTLGIGIGAIFYSVLAMTGLSALLSRIGWAAHLVQLAGGLYLIYLAISAWLSKALPHEDGAPAGEQLTFAAGTRRGVLVCLSNPKAIAFFVGLYAAAIPVSTALWAKIVILTTSFSLELLWYGTMTMFLMLPPIQAAFRRFSLTIQRTIGVALAGFGLRLVATSFTSR
jgi:threonine/homoserine/homoserine lactone efflux protein